MIRVYFRTGRNSIKSKLYDADLLDGHRSGELRIVKTSEITIVGTVTKGMWWWKEEVVQKNVYPRYTTVAVYAKGEWVRWEREPEPKEKKHEDPVQS
jgi:hypothetical protein